MYQVNIDFDLASKKWKENKISIGNGCYKYRKKKRIEKVTSNSKKSYNSKNHRYNSKNHRYNLRNHRYNNHRYNSKNHRYNLRNRTT